MPGYISSAKLRTYMGSPCPYCRRPMGERGLRSWPSREHMLPISRGGPRTGNNLIVVCQECNSLKDAMTLEEFCAWLAWYYDPRAAYVRGLIDWLMTEIPEEAALLVGRTPPVGITLRVQDLPRPSTGP